MRHNIHVIRNLYICALRAGPRANGSYSPEADFPNVREHLPLDTSRNRVFDRLGIEKPRKQGDAKSAIHGPLLYSIP